MFAGIIKSMKIHVHVCSIFGAFASFDTDPFLTHCLPHFPVVATCSTKQGLGVVAKVVPKGSVSSTSFVARTTDTPARLERERAKATFPIRQMTYYLDGSPEMTAIKEAMMAELAANPVFNDDEWNDLSRAQYRERTLQRVREAYKLLMRDGADVARRNVR